MNRYIHVSFVMAAGIAVVLASRAIAAESITVEFMAAKTSWIKREFVGHAFLCVRIPTSSGVKEDCFGFYPKDGHGIIGGPGAVVSEFARNPARFGRITVSVVKTISPAERQRLYRVIKEWNSHHYEFTNQNCIDFVKSAALAVGLQAPERRDIELPEKYLRKLKDANP
jgi:hypothetical protein